MAGNHKMSEYSAYEASIYNQTTSSAAAIALDQSLFTGAKILLVEDDSTVTSMLKEWLQNEQYQIHIERDGAGALQKLYSEPYDMILVNRQLADVSGIDVCKRFPAFGGETPMIVTSDTDCIEDKEQCFEAGVNDYMTKPYNLRELSARIRAKIRRAKAFGNK